MISQPLELRSRLSPPPRDLDFFAWVNVAVIALFFGLLGSRFILPPGVPIGGEDQSVVLPEVTEAVEGATPASVVVSYRRDNVILFEGGMYNLTELRRQLESYAAKHPRSVMLVQIDRQVSTQAFLDLAAMAKAVGFAQVVIAAEQSPVEK